VTARGTAKSEIFLDDVDRSAFVQLLASVIERFDWACRAYCLMTTHYHLIVESPLHGLSRGMARLNGIYAQAFNERHDRRGHLFEGRFVAYVIDSDDHLEAACNYVIDNPVRAGLCTDRSQWAWSGLGPPALMEEKPRDCPSVLQA
jgi:REP element-mobilizing transposase RayT